MNKKINNQLQRLFMRLSFVNVFLVSALIAQGATNTLLGQEVLNKKVNFTARQESLSVILRRIESLGGVKFSYLSSIVDNQSKTSVDVKDQSLQELLDELLKPLDLKYEIFGNQIILNRLVTNTNAIYSLQLIQGVIFNEKGEPIAGATVSDKKNPKTATSTSTDGSFTLNVEMGATLIVSAIGYEQQTVVVDRSTMQVRLKVSDNALEEVVVVGYGSQKKSTVTGSISSVSGDALRQIPTANITNAIAGNIPGVISTTPNGTPGSGSNLQIRGITTLNDNSPLVVVDGVVRYDGFGNIDSDEIESITVLKDASAASVYGARAANGVFLITTKRGKMGKPVITYSGMIGKQQPTNYPKLMSAYQFASLRNKALKNMSYDPGNPNHAGLFYSEDQLTDFQSRGDKNVWYDATFKKNSMQHDQNVSVNGGTEVIKYFASVGIFDQDGMYDNINFKRYNFRSNTDARINKNLVVKLGFEGRQENSNNPGFDAGSIFAAVLRQNPTYSILNSDGSYFNTTGEHPVAMYESTGYNRNVWNVFQGSLSFEHKLSFITEGLSLNGLYSIYKDRLFNKTFFTPYTMYDVNASGQVTGTKLVGNQTSLNQRYQESDQQFYNLSVNYDHNFGKHEVRGVLVYEEYNSKGNTFFAYRQQFLSNIKDELFASGNENQNLGGNGIITDARRSVIGRVNYNFADRYLLEGVFRSDGSYRFPIRSRWGFFPAISAGWVMSEEPFFKDSPINNVVSYLKFFGSTGLTGNDRVQAFQFLDNYSIVSASGPILDGSSTPRLNYGVYPNATITWEKQQSTNFGINAVLLNSKINLNFEYFIRNTKDILMARALSVPSTFGRDLPTENYGEMSNRGWEASLGYREKIGAVNANFNFNISHVVNKVTKIDDPVTALDYQRQLGRVYGFRSGYETDGIFRTQEEADAWFGGQQFGQKSLAGDLRYVDINGNGQIDIQDQKVISNYNNTPRMMFGLSSTLSWKQFDLNFLVQGAAQRNLMIQGTGRVLYAGGGASGNFAYLEDSWTPDNINAEYPIAWTDARSINNRNSTFWLKDAGYVRLKSASLGYTLDNTWLHKNGISKIRVYLSGFNLLTWSQIKQFDPEVSAGNGLYYPQQQNFNFGINLTL